MAAPDRLADYTTDLLREHQSLEFCKWLSCLDECGVPSLASARYLERWPRSVSSDIIRKSIAIYETKAAMPPGTTLDPSWASPLVGVQPLADAFLAIARSASLLGRIPNLRMVPFSTPIPVETQGANFYWVQQGTPKPVSRMTFAAGIKLDPTKAAGIIVVTDELATVAVPGTERALRDTLIAGLTAFTDAQLLDPAVAAVVNVHPASITHGLTPVASTGDLAKDVGTLLATFFTARPGAQAVLVMNGGTSARLAGPAGNTPYGVTIVTSAAAAGNVIVLDPAGVLVADGGVEIDTARHATLELVDTPVSPADATAVMTSLWQHNLTGFRTERLVNWAAVPGAVAYLAGA